MEWNPKRQVAVLIPYKRKDGAVHAYLQKRTKDAKFAPGHYGFWGGGLEEGETAEEALRRETQEELNFTLETFQSLGIYTFEHAVIHAFTMEVDDTFETSIEIHEGDGGKWFTQEQLAHEPLVVQEDAAVLKEFFSSFQG